MLKLKELFSYFPAGTTVTIEDDHRYLVLNEQLDNVKETFTDGFLERSVKKITAGIKSFHIWLHDEEEPNVD